MNVISSFFFFSVHFRGCCCLVGIVLNAEWRLPVAWSLEYPAVCLPAIDNHKKIQQSILMVNIAVPLWSLPLKITCKWNALWLQPCQTPTAVESRLWRNKWFVYAASEIHNDDLLIIWSTTNLVIYIFIAWKWCTLCTIAVLVFSRPDDISWVPLDTVRLRADDNISL